MFRFKAVGTIARFSGRGPCGSIIIIIIMISYAKPSEILYVLCFPLKSPNSPFCLPMAPFFLLLSLSKSFIDMLIQFQLQKPSCSYNKSHRKMPPDGWNAAPPFLPLSFSSRDRPTDQSVSWIQLRHFSRSLFRHVIAQCFVVGITTHNKMFSNLSYLPDTRLCRQWR